MRGGRLFWQVTFPDGSQYIAENQLEVIGDNIEDSLDFFQQGKFGRAKDLRGAITHIRLSGRLADLIYSMETTNTDFYPYQFKPVINFLESPSRGILIADEVGLGKTIEAGLIWTELRSRYDTRRLMVLCPAMLREKWKVELQRRFGITADTADTGDVLTTFKEYKAGNLNDFALVASMQGLRPPKGWEDDENVAHKIPASLARFLSENAHDEPLLDLLIVDEAHYLRNSQSMTAKLGRLLRDVADHVVLLSATPIHLNNQDLYQLLNLVDEDSFNQIHVFDDILEANAPLIRARDMIMGGRVNPEEFLGQLQQAIFHPLLHDNRQLRGILESPPTNDDLASTSYRSELAYRLESINLLGHAVTRTRKREVTEWRVVRQAIPEIVEPTQAEAKFYAKVTGLVRKYSLEHEAHEGFLLVTPQRQISSSMPAALREWQKRQFELEQTIYEDSGGILESLGEMGPLVQTIIQHASELGDIKELWENDSKYRRLCNELKRYLHDHPKEKIVVFAYFRPTLRYLHERLSTDGISSIVLVGGGQVDKYEVMEKFKSPHGPSVLLASEVASEGVDLQFSRVVVNYDLPWNPMKVEQRIGRIDRLGQPSPTIIIWNLFYANTIDARIYDRLYLRLGIFEYALGGLEAVLGDEIQKLTIDLLRGHLTKEKEEERITQTEQAISNLRKQEEQLENSACNLIAHGDYILRQVRAARELGRWITGEDIWSYIRDFFNTKYPGCEFQQLQEGELIFEVRLSEDARFDFDRFMQARKLTGQSRLVHSTAVRCQFKNQVPQQRRTRYEQVNQFHPLIRFVSESIQKSLESMEMAYFPTVSLCLRSKEVPELVPGEYLFYVERWTVKGVKDIERMVYCARPASATSRFLEDSESEKIITMAAQVGSDWLSVANEVDVTMLAATMEECLEFVEERYREYVAKIEDENNDRADLQEKALHLHLERQRDKLHEVLQKHIDKGRTKMVAPTQGLIEKMENRVRDKLRLIQERRKLHHHRKDVCLGVIRLS